MIDRCLGFRDQNLCSLGAALATCLLVGWLTSGCGGGAPLLHPAHPLPAGVMSAGAGLSSNVALGTLDADIAAGEAESEGGTPESVARRAFIAPGLSSWFAARLGLADAYEGGLTVTGRVIRVDARRAFRLDKWALSAGLGGSSVLARRTKSDDGAAAGVLGFGVDLPLLVGWQSTGDIVSLWAGLRPGYERLGNFSAVGDEDPGQPGPPSSLADAERWYAGALLGVSVGVHPIWFSAELGAAQHWVDATEQAQPETGGPDVETSVRFRGFTLAPAGAVSVRF